MIDALVLHGKAARTQQTYIAAVAQLARHYRRSPDTLSGGEIEAYLLHLLRERKLSRSTVNRAGCAINFLFGKVLGRDGPPCAIPLPRGPQKLPEILSREEIGRLLAGAPSPKARTLLACAYGLGLRVSELCALRPEHIDAAADRMCVRVGEAQGAKDRYVPLAEDLLEMLRQYWRAARPRQWLFPGYGDAARPVDIKTAQRGYRRARAAAGIGKAGGIHTLRHCYATHLLEAGVDSRPASRSGSATRTSAPPRAICIWPGPMHPTAPAAARWRC